MLGTSWRGTLNQLIGTLVRESNQTFICRLLLRQLAQVTRLGCEHSRQVLLRIVLMCTRKIALGGRSIQGCDFTLVPRILFRNIGSTSHYLDLVVFCIALAFFTTIFIIWNMSRNFREISWTSCCILLLAWLWRPLLTPLSCQGLLIIVLLLVLDAL